MKVREFVASQKELVVIASILAGLGVATKVKADVQEARATVVVRVDTLAVLSSDVTTIRTDMRELRQDVTAMLRVACVTNKSKWDAFETAGIKCGDLIPSATQAGRTRR